MLRTYRTPADPMHQLRHEMDRLLTGFFDQGADWAQPPAGRAQPAINLWETDDAVVLESELPGVTSDQLEIAVVGDELTLKVNRPDTGQEGVTYHRQERPVGSWTRVLRLPAAVEADKVQARLQNGVLTVLLPKAETAKPRKIKVLTTN